MNLVEIARNNFNSWNRHGADAIVAEPAQVLRESRDRTKQVTAKSEDRAPEERASADGSADRSR